MNKLFKKLGIILLIGFVIFRSIMPAVVLADDLATSDPSSDTQTQSVPDQNENASPTPTDSPAPSDSPEPSPTDSPLPTESPAPTPNPDVQADSAVNDSSSSAVSTPAPDLTVDNSSGLQNNVDSDANTGQNTSTSSATTNTGTTNTGDAVSEVQAQNDVNTTNIDSNIYYQTINIYTSTDGDIDLSVPQEVVSDLISNKNLTSSNIDVSMIDNSSYVINNISSTANTGGNTGGNIDTGNAYSVISLLNNVNMTVVNSHVHIVTINIFGSLNGNIMLPVLYSNDGTCALCGTTQSIMNSALLSNNVSSIANSGENDSNATDSAISTGNAISYISLFNVVNASYVNIDAASLFVNNFGDWSGNYLGFTDDKTNISPNGFSDSNLLSDSDTTLDNDAYLENNINSIANTGLNTGNNIKTGNAFSVISLINFVNTTFINSNSFFGFINIFGKLKGDIGRVDLFKSDTVASAADDNSDQMESGGKFDVSSSNNSGSFILPGDTLTEFVIAKNTGSGKIYNAKLLITLTKNGENYGQSTFDLGDIDAGKQVKLSTGLVLGTSTPQGSYSIEAYVYGNTFGGTIDGISNNTFNIGGFSQNINTVFAAPLSSPGNTIKVLADSRPQVSTKDSKTTQNYAGLVVLLVGLYFLTDKLKKDDQMFAFLSKKTKKKSKKSARS